MLWYTGEGKVLVMSQRATRSRNRVTLLLSLIIQNQDLIGIVDTITGTTSGPFNGGGSTAEGGCSHPVLFLDEP
jgi:hypothetical protein